MRQIPDDVLYDSRLVERHIAQGLVTREQVEKYIASLPDAAELAEVIDLDEFSRKPNQKGEPS